MTDGTAATAAATRADRKSHSTQARRRHGATDGRSTA